MLTTLLPTDTGVLKLIREVGAGVDSLESLAEDLPGAGGVSFETSLESFTTMRATGSSFKFLDEAASLLVWFAVLDNVRALGMHAIRDSLSDE